MPASAKEIAMQFELSAGNLDASMLATALRPHDPDARIVLDVTRGRLEVISTATATQVQDALQDISCEAKPLEQEVHISEGSTCCGHCT